jgi:hypothetical protein
MVLLSLAISAEAFAFVFLHYVVRIDWSPDYLTSEGQPAALVGLTERDRPPGRPVLLGEDACALRPRILAFERVEEFRRPFSR